MAQTLVLVANSNSSHAPLIAEKLGVGYDVRGVTEVEEAVAWLEAHEVEVVIADVRWVEKSPRLRDLTIAKTCGRLIVTSGLAERPPWWDGLFLPYPEGITTIRRAVEHALEAQMIAA